MTMLRAMAFGALIGAFGMFLIIQFVLWGDLYLSSFQRGLIVAGALFGGFFSGMFCDKHIGSEEWRAFFERRPSQ